MIDKAEAPSKRSQRRGDSNYDDKGNKIAQILPQNLQFHSNPAVSPEELAAKTLRELRKQELVKELQNDVLLYKTMKEELDLLSSLSSANENDPRIQDLCCKLVDLDQQEVMSFGG